MSQAQTRIPWRRMGKKIGRAMDHFFTNASVRILFACLITVVLVLGFLSENNSQLVYGWLPGWYPNVYAIVAASLSAQPLIASIFDASTKRRINRAIRKLMNDAFGELSGPVREIARITYEKRWTDATARSFERQVVRTIRHLFTLLDVPEPRVCFYLVSATDETTLNSSGLPPVNELQYVTHHGGVDPSRIFRRDRKEAEGLFEALDNGQRSSEVDRMGYDPDKHNWRSALRIPIAHDGTQYGVLTLDSPAKDGASDSHDKILGFAAALICLARLCETKGRGPSVNDVLENFTASQLFANKNDT